jgi:hypothetical protein
MPVFPRYSDEIKRLALQLIAMIDDARNRLLKENIKLNAKIVIGGFS